MCCVALRCNPLCCVTLCCVAIRCVVSVLLRCVALCSDPLCRCCVVSVELRWVVLRCDPWHNTRCVALCCVVLLTRSAFLVFHLIMLKLYIVDILN